MASIGWLPRISVLLVVAGCAAAAPPDPRLAVEQYARAVEQGNAQALYDFLDADSQRAITRDELAELVRSTRTELVSRARTWTADDAQRLAQARVVFRDGRVGYLALEQGKYRVDTAGLMPSAARTPVEALDELRRALLVRSYPALARVLALQTQAQMEEQLSSLAESLAHPETLEIQVNGDSAVVLTQRGHRVQLTQEDGFWKIRDFE